MNKNDDITIFILDDSPDFIKIIDMCLIERNETGYKTFTEWQELLKECTETKPDIIITDFVLEGELTGVCIMKKVREISPYCRYAFMSNLMSFDELKTLNNAGCGYFIDKGKNFLFELLKAMEIEREFVRADRIKRSETAQRECRVSEKVNKVIDIIDKGKP
jgi:DNA-binding NtrC family response regulator